MDLDAISVFGGLRTTKAQTSFAYVQSDQHLWYSLIGKYHIQTCCEQNFSVAEETGLKLPLSDTPKTGFLAMRPILKGKATLKASESEMQALIKPCNLPDRF